MHRIVCCNRVAFNEIVINTDDYEKSELLSADEIAGTQGNPPTTKKRTVIKIPARRAEPKAAPKKTATKAPKLTKKDVKSIHDMDLSVGTRGYSLISTTARFNSRIKTSPKEIYHEFMDMNAKSKQADKRNVVDDARKFVRNIIVRDRYYTSTLSCYADCDLIPSETVSRIAKGIFPDGSPSRNVISDYTGTWFPFPAAAINYAAPEQMKGYFNIGSLCNIAATVKKNIEASSYSLINALLKGDNAMDNIFIAGGLISNAICGTLQLIDKSDVDIFIYGLDERAANKKVKEIIGLFNLYIKGMTTIIEHDDVHLIKNKCTISILYDRKWYQIIFRLYKTKSEILHGFDIGASSVGWDGKEVYFTSLSMFAYLTGYIIHDPSKASPTYEIRLRKYADRGFRILFPFMKSITGNIDVGEITTYRSGTNLIIDGCRYSLVRYVYANKEFRDREAELKDIDYSSITEGGGVDKIECINSRLSADYLWSKAIGHKCIPSLKELKIPEINGRIHRNIIKGDRLNVRKINKFYPEAAMMKILSAHIYNDDRIIKTVIDEQVSMVNARIKEFEKTVKFKKIEWISNTPGAQRVAIGTAHKPQTPEQYFGDNFEDWNVPGVGWRHVRLLWIGNRDPECVLHILDNRIIKHIAVLSIMTDTSEIWFDTKIGINTIRALTRTII